MHQILKLAEIAFVLMYQLSDRPNVDLVVSCAMIQPAALYNVMLVLEVLCTEWT